MKRKQINELTSAQCAVYDAGVHWKVWRMLAAVSQTAPEKPALHKGSQRREAVQKAIKAPEQQLTPALTSRLAQIALLPVARMGECRGRRG